MISMKMSEGGRVVIPAEIRRELALNDGDIVLWEMRDGLAVITTRDQQLRQIQAQIKAIGNPNDCWSDELIADRRAETARE